MQRQQYACAKATGTARMDTGTGQYRQHVIDVYESRTAPRSPHCHTVCQPAPLRCRIPTSQQPAHCNRGTGNCIQWTKTVVVMFASVRHIWCGWQQHCVAPPKHLVGTLTRAPASSRDAGTRPLRRLSRHHKTQRTTATRSSLLHFTFNCDRAYKSAQRVLSGRPRRTCVGR